MGAEGIRCLRGKRDGPTRQHIQYTWDWGAGSGAAFSEKFFAWLAIVYRGSPERVSNLELFVTLYLWKSFGFLVGGWYQALDFVFWDSGVENIIVGEYRKMILSHDEKESNARSVWIMVDSENNGAFVTSPLGELRNNMDLKKSIVSDD